TPAAFSRWGIRGYALLHFQRERFHPAIPLRTCGIYHQRYYRCCWRTLRHYQEPGTTALVHAEPESHEEYSSIRFRRRCRTGREACAYIKELAVNAAHWRRGSHQLVVDATAVRRHRRSRRRRRIRSAQVFYYTSS